MYNSRVLKRIFYILLALIILILTSKYGYEAYILIKYPEPETYYEDFKAHTKYCNQQISCIGSLVCEFELQDCTSGCIKTCSNKSGATKGLSRYGSKRSR